MRRSFEEAVMIKTRKPFSVREIEAFHGFFDPILASSDETTIFILPLRAARKKEDSNDDKNIHATGLGPPESAQLGESKDATPKIFGVMGNSPHKIL